MQLEKQVSSLELSKRLRELGVRQESYFRWYQASLIPWTVVTSHGFSNEEARERSPSAFTVAELGEMLPHEMTDEHQDLPYFLTCEKCEESDYWMVCYRGDRGVLGGLREEARTEADARAALLIYLLENKLISNE